MTSTERKRASRHKPVEPTRGKAVFTSGQVAKLCKVAPRTVSKWFDAGRLKGYRIPGSQGRRIPRESLIRFLKDHNMPLGDLEAEMLTRVLLVAVDGLLDARLRADLTAANRFCVEAVATAFDAGTALADFHPDALVIDLALGRGTACQVAGKVKAIAGGGDCPLLVALAGEDETDAAALIAGGFDEVFQQPFDPALLTERLRQVAVSH